jgi:hypothetical protein
LANAAIRGAKRLAAARRVANILVRQSRDARDVEHSPAEGPAGNGTSDGLDWSDPRAKA